MRRIRSFISLLLLTIFCLSSKADGLSSVYAGKITVQVGKTVRVDLPGQNGYYMENYGTGNTATWMRTGTNFIITAKKRSYCEIKGSAPGKGTLSYVGGYIVGWQPELLDFYWDVEIVLAPSVKVTAINLNTYSKEIKPNESFQLTATIYPNDAANKSVTWESDNEEVATVTSTGLVKGVSMGTTEITCKATDGSGVSNKCRIIVKSDKFTVKTTEGAELSCEVTDESAKTCKVSSSTIPSSVTKVTIPSNANGYRVTALGDRVFDSNRNVESVMIPNTVTSIGNQAFHDCSSLATITIPNSVTSIGDNAFSGCSSLTYIDIPNGVRVIGSYAFYRCGLTSVTIGNSVESIGSMAFSRCSELSSVIIPSSVTNIDPGIFWETDNLEEIIVESGNSVYDSREHCNAIIETETNRLINGCINTKILHSIKTIGGWAYFYGEKSAFDSLVIPANVENLERMSIRIKNLKKLTIGKGVKHMDNPFSNCAPKVIRSLIEYPNNDTLFTSDDTFSKTEVVYVPKGTKSRYLASTSWSKFPNIVEANFVTDVTFANSSIEIPQGKSMQLTANITPADADNKELEWESTDEDVVMVTSTGKIIAMGVGTAYVYATAMDCGSTYGTCKVTVTAPYLITDIILDMTAATLSPGESLQITPTITPANAKNQELEWYSSNEDVAMVTSNGKVVAMGKGTAVITATAKDGTGVSASCQITVTQKVKSISLNHTTYSLDIGESVTLEAIVKPDNAEDKSVTWTSSDENILVVNKNGRVVCLEYGTATITATTNDDSNLSASCVFNCADGIDDIKQDGKKRVIHSVTGIKRIAPKKGVNVINGKKVLIK